MQPQVKCLLVDDLEENLLALSALLARPGVELLKARSGAEALELLLAHQVALAILDVQMPEMDGFELAELMRGSERTREVPIIFITAGGADKGRLFKGYESGAVDFLHKPIEPHMLMSKVNVFFQLHRQKLQLAQELRERTETLRLNELFTAMLAHDLRSPLSAIVMSSTLLERKAADDTSRKAARRLLTSAQHMGRMINDMLDLARARFGAGIPLKRGPADLGPVLQRVVQEHRDGNPGRDIRLAQHGEPTGDWDADRLAQGAVNLIGNALVHGDRSQPVEVLLDGMQAEAVRLVVANAGQIPPERLPSLFDPFSDIEQRTGRDAGLGLGLYIVREIVRSHGGSVDVETEPDAGPGGRTVFTVTLPRSPGLPS